MPINSCFPGGGTDTSDATAAASDILSGKTAYVNDVKLTGSMPNNGALSYTPNQSAQNIPAGYTSGGSVAAVTFDASKVLDDATIAGKQGTYPSNPPFNQESYTIAGTYNFTVPVGVTRIIFESVTNEDFSTISGYEQELFCHFGSCSNSQGMNSLARVYRVIPGSVLTVVASIHTQFDETTIMW